MKSYKRGLTLFLYISAAVILTALAVISPINAFAQDKPASKEGSPAAEPEPPAHGEEADWNNSYDKASTSGHYRKVSLEYGIKAGINSFTVYYFGGPISADDAGVKSHTGIIGGAFLTVNLNRLFALQTELLYAQRNWNYEINDIEEYDTIGNYLGTTNAKTEVRTSYIEIPILAKFTLPVTDTVRSSVYAGPAFAVKLSARQRDWLSGHEIHSTTITDHLKSADLGAIIGLGLTVRHFSADVRYNLGLTAMTSSTVTTVVGRMLSIMAGYKF